MSKAAADVWMVTI